MKRSVRKKYSKYIITIICTSIISSFLQTYPLNILKNIIDFIDIDNSAYVFKVCVLYVLCIFISHLLNSFQNHMTYVCINLYFFDLRNKTFNRLMHLNQKFFDRSNSSDLLGIVMQDTEKVSHGTISPISNLCRAVFGLGFGLYFMFMISIEITLVILPVTAIIAIVSSIYSKKLNIFAKNGRRKNAITWKCCTQCTQGIREIHSNCKEVFFYNKFLHYSEEMKNNDLNSIKYKTKVEVINSSMISVLITIIFIMGFIFIFDKKITTGSLVSLLTYNSLLIAPIQAIVYLFHDVSMKNASLERINIIVGEKIDDVYNSSNNSISFTSDKIVFDNVNFSYDGNRKIINSLSLTIRKDTFVAFVGDTGGGKSTIFKLIDGIYTPTSGKISIFGNETNHKNIINIREIISFCFQEPFIIDGSILDNILFSNNDASEEEINLAIKSSMLKELLDKLPNGINTMVGERGFLLSGGERQRIGIARMLLKKADIYIMDEATSALDNDTEVEVMRNIMMHYKYKTILVIAHKLSSITKADNIFYISNGKVIEEGKHNDLMSYDSKYKKLYNSNSRYLD